MLKNIEKSKENQNFVQYLLCESISLQKSHLCEFDKEDLSFSKFEIYWFNFSLYYNNDDFLKIIRSDDKSLLYELNEILLRNFHNYFLYLIENFQTIKEVHANYSQTNFLPYFENYTKVLLVFYKIVRFMKHHDYLRTDKTLTETIEKASKELGYEESFLSDIVDYSFIKFGQAILNFDGKFCWADKYMHLLYKKKKLVNEFLINMLTLDSKYTLECLYKGLGVKGPNDEEGKGINTCLVQNITKNKPDKDVILSYTVWNMQLEGKAYNNKSDFINEIFINYLNESVRLVSRFNSVIEGAEEKITLESRLSMKRNFEDDLLFFHNFR